MTDYQRAAPARLRLVVNRDSGGYRSGRSSDRDTPDSSSTFSTRLGGTPERRHFCTAWYLTPQPSANSARPPAPLIARSTASLMDANLQPIIVSRQQPVRAWSGTTMQPMVEAAKHLAREDFSKWLNAQCARLSAPVRGRPKWLKKRLEEQAGLRVSYETCRKWLGGLDIPDRANEALLHKALGVHIQAESADEQFEILRNVWRSLPEKSRTHLLETALLAQTAAKVDKAEEPKKRRRIA